MRKTRQGTLIELVKETYRELYQNCTTPVNFDLLVEQAEIDEFGHKRIPYNKYFIDEVLAKEIIARNMKEMRLTKYEKQAFNFEMCLGCGPVYIYENEK